jgi:short-subunit dehydrogenase
MKNRIWFITGISSGLGKALAQTVIESGDFLIGTFRNQSQADRFNAEHKGKALALTLDVTDFNEMEKVVKLVIDKFEKIDVLVNNAGYGLAGSIEETSNTEIRDIFEANFFAALRLTQLFLPSFRNHKSGHIIQISSHGGFKAFAGFGIYNASKFALEGFSEALAQEVAPLGIKVTIVEPGPFRTNFASKGFKLASHIIAEYDTTSGIFREKIKAVDGKQEGDPNKAAKAIHDITKIENTPLRLPLGKIALLSLTTKLESVKTDLENYKDIAASVVY